MLLESLAKAASTSTIDNPSLAECQRDWTREPKSTLPAEFSSWPRGYQKHECHARTNVGNLLFACQEQTTNGQLVANGWYTTAELVNEKAFAELDWLESFATYDSTGGAMHDGAELGITAQVLVLPNAQVYIAVMTNTEDGAAEEIAAAVAKMALGDGTDVGPTSSGGGGLLCLLAAVLAFLTSCF
jgi:hypothetical protein